MSGHKRNASSFGDRFSKVILHERLEPVFNHERTLSRTESLSLVVSRLLSYSVMMASRFLPIANWCVGYAASPNEEVDGLKRFALVSSDCLEHFPVCLLLFVGFGKSFRETRKRRPLLGFGLSSGGSILYSFSFGGRAIAFSEMETGLTLMRPRSAIPLSSLSPTKPNSLSAADASFRFLAGQTLSRSAILRGECE